MKRIVTLLVAVTILALVASAPAVVINEFLYTTDGNNAFIELMNRTDKDGSPQAIDIGGWKLQKGTPAGGWTDILTIDNLTTLTATGASRFYLIATQDVFVTAPDKEVNMTVDKPTSNEVLGLRLVSKTANTTDTVLYGLAAASNFGSLADDTGLQDAARVLKVDAVALPGGGTTNMNTDIGSGARRRDVAGSAAEGAGGVDENNAATDFIGYTAGHASPQSRTTPVTLSVFEAR